MQISRRLFPLGQLAAVACGFVALTLVPLLMNAFPHGLGYAFSEHYKYWRIPVGLFVTVVAVAALAGAVVGLTGAWCYWRAARKNASVDVAAPSASSKIVGALCVLHGPILVALFYAMWISARIALGRWPAWGGADDPKFIFGASVIHSAIVVWFWLCPIALAVPLSQGRLARSRGQTSASGYFRQFRLALVLLLFSVAHLATDPWHLVAWFLD